MEVIFDMDTDPPESLAPMIDSDLMIVEWEDIFYRRPRYCGGDLHDMMNTDSSEPDVCKRMDTPDLVYMCRTVAQDERWSDTDDNSDTDSVAELEYNTWDDACTWEFRNALGNIPPGLVQNPLTEIIRNYEMDDNSDTDSVAELEYKTLEDACAWECQSAPVNIPPGLIQNPLTDKIRKYETDDSSDTDSVAELEYSTWDDTCAWECRIALLILIQNPPTDIMGTYTENDECSEKFGRGGCVDSSLHPPWICFGQQHCWGDGEIQNNANTPIRGSYPKLMNCRQTEDMDRLPHAVCCDCVWLMPLIRITMPLFSDGDGTVNRTGYDGDYDGSVPQLNY